MFLLEPETPQGDLYTAEMSLRRYQEAIARGALAERGEVRWHIARGVVEGGVRSTGSRSERSTGDSREVGWQ